MGWGITLYPQIYYSKVDFRSKYDIEEEINETKNVIKMLEDKLLSLVLTTEPNKIVPKDTEGSPLDWILNEYRDIMGGYDCSLKDYYYKLWKLELLHENWDNAHNKDNNAICPPKDTFPDYDTAYMDGDYVNAVYPDGSDPK